MNKIKVIDLLNMISKGEDVPRVKYDDIEAYIGADGYLKDDYGDNVEWWIDNKWLNTEVEIIEEDKKIESLINCVNGVLNGQMSSYYEKTDLQVIVEHNFKVIQEKINEIIDKMNKE